MHYRYGWVFPPMGSTALERETGMPPMLLWSMAYIFLAATTVQLTRNKNKQQQSHLTTLNPGELETVNWVDQLQQVLSNTVALHFNGHIQVDLGRPVPECLHSGFYWS